MAVNSVDMTKALKNEAYAAQVIRSGKCSASERGQLASQWGADKITKWESIDSTQYEITDDEKQIAKSKGDKKVDEATGGFDGQSDGTKSAVATGMAATGAAAGIGAAGIALFVQKTWAAAHTADKAGRASAFVAAGVGAILVGLSQSIKSMDPNNEQAQACDDLKETMDESQNELAEQQGILEDTSEEVVDTTDELTEASDEVNKTTEVKQKEYEKMQQEYQELAAKYEASKTGGEPLTEGEKAKFAQLSGTLGAAFEELQQVKIDGEANIEDVQEAVEEKQEVYDDAAMKMEEVQEITDFQAEFDEATVDNAQMVKVAAIAGEVGSAGVIYGGLKGLAQWGNWAAMAAGAVAVAEGGISAKNFANIMIDQNSYKHRAENGVENRHATEDVNTATSEVYDTELDNFAGSLDLIDEIELTETTATETQIVELSDDTKAPSSEEGADETASPLNTPDVNPFAPPTSGDDGSVDGADDIGSDNSNPFVNPNKKDEEI